VEINDLLRDPLPLHFCFLFRTFFISVKQFEIWETLLTISYQRMNQQLASVVRYM